MDTALSAYPPIAEARGVRIWEKMCFGFVVVGLVILTWAALAHRFFNPLFADVLRHPYLSLFYRPALIWAALGTFLLIFRSCLWMRYRGGGMASQDDVPSLTVIIPAFNEGPMVGTAIDSVARARYPRSRLEIIAIDDGSTDDTFEHIQAATERYPELVTSLRFRHNLGKRAALAEGFRRARGEVIVTVDSDSNIRGGALLAIVEPFRDPKVGAVAGKVCVLNRRQGLIPRMLQVQFILSFDLVRAVQSTYGVVQCCPGALSAYRASAVRSVLESWLSQTFLGQRCTYGEDRALTNSILSLGYRTLYERNAVVDTLVPVTYPSLCRMYLRWERSNIRESLCFIPIVVRFPLRVRLIALFESVISNLRYPVWYVALGMLICLTWHNPLTIARVLASIGLMSLFNMLYYLRSERSIDFIYGVLYAYFSFFGLAWIFIGALCTLRSRSWMTR